MSEVACIVPAFNAERTLPPVLAGLRAALPDATLVGIDDGSSDATQAVLREGCDVVESFPRNRGKGAALRAGFHQALKLGVRAVVTIDADGQHDPSYAPRLLEALGAADIAVGQRMRGGTAMPLRRRLSNALSSAAISAVAGRRLPDTQCGYRAIRRPVLEMVQGVGDRYEFETDFIIRAARRGFSIVAVPVPTIYGAASHFREFHDAIRVVATIWRHRTRPAA